MPFSTIVLLLVSGLGVLHGLLLAILLWSNSKNNTAYKLLGGLLAVFSFRVGKSVFLYFGPDLDVQWILIGLATLTLIGPLFLFFVRFLLQPSLRLKSTDALHLIPFFLGLLFGLWIDQEAAANISELYFVFLFVFYYLHYLVYLFWGYSAMQQAKKRGSNTKELEFLHLVLFGLLAVWVVYVLNLFEEQIPYVIGPVLYGIVAYGISFLVIKRGYVQLNDPVKYSGSTLTAEQIQEIFGKITKFVVQEREFANPEISLKSLSDRLKLSPQSISQVINQTSKLNFNQFINFYRIQEATKLLEDGSTRHLTVSAIAYEVGFNSLTSFNTAFKKVTGKTPSSYRQSLV